MAFDFKALAEGTYGLVLGEHRDLTPEQSVATFTLDYINDDNVLFVSALDMRDLGRHGYMEIEFQRRERRELRDGSIGWLPDTIIRVRMREGGEPEFSGPSFNYTRANLTWYRLAQNLAVQAAKMLREPAEADVLPEPAAVPTSGKAEHCEICGNGTPNRAIYHNGKPLKVCVDCTVHSDTSRAFGRVPEQAALDYAETQALEAAGPEGFA